MAVCLLTAPIVLAGCEVSSGRAEPVESRATITDRSVSDPPSVGRWRVARESEGLSAAQEQARRLESVGYLGGSRKPPERSGVVRHLPGVQAGLNFYTSGHAAEAVLMDLNGGVLHTWSRSFEEIFPDYSKPASAICTQFWRTAHLFENGDVLVLFEGLGIARLDRNSRVLWARDLPTHHDLQVQPNGEIYVLTRYAREIPRVNERAPTLEDRVAVLDPEGNLIKEVSILEMFENSVEELSWKPASRRFWKRRGASPSDPLDTLSERLQGDIFHTNSIRVLEGRIADRVPEFAAGNLLLSMCHLDRVAVADLEKERFVWALDIFKMQHDPSITPDGKLLVFDNHWRHHRSSVTVIDPATRKVEWQYAGTEAEPFFSYSCGTAIRLANGNTIITESDNGRALEITPDRRVVWEFRNPARAGENGEYVATLLEVVRLPADFPTDWIPAREPPLPVEATH